MKRNNKKRHIEEHEESWAVSYADLLMVLMSFFIVFFNLEQGSGEDNLVDVISKSFTGEVKEGKQKRSISSNGTFGNLIIDLKDNDLKFNAIDGNGDTIRDKKLPGIHSDFDKKTISELKKVKGLIIELPDDIFSVGAHELSNKAKDGIDSVLSKLSEYSEKITIIAIGHSDTIPLRHDREIVKSNFILSSLRAAKAVEYIVGKGFDSNWVLGQAVNVERRATRSLSIKVFERI